MIEIAEQNLCISGGADDSDLQWGMCAGRAGHSVIHYSFAGHRNTAPPSEIVVLTPEQLLEADPALLRANATLGRTFPARDQSTNSLLRRNWYQVRDAQAVYAVSTLRDGKVEGGTAWAIQMFIDRHDGAACAVYLFDQKSAQWFTWWGSWQPIETPPAPSGVWAGIGTRKLNPAGKQAIRGLMGYNPSACPTPGVELL